MAEVIDYTLMWPIILDNIHKKIGDTTFSIWFANIKFKAQKDRTLFLEVPGLITKEWLDERHRDFIKEQVNNIDPSINQIEIQTQEKLEANAASHSQFNEKYTFDSFVVGNSNKFAHAACYAVAESPATAYNPLFIYGGVGLGKTHLMHAIAHRIFEKYPFYKIKYITSEQFTNELITAIQTDNTSNFRQKYRGIDVLLIDDIQFLASKERTQEEFFHTFNTLYNGNRQLIISSDRPPKNIPTLEDRLRSRFEWGLIADIQIPDLETRIAILRKKAKNDNLQIPNEVINYIAAGIDSNIRELEGALIRLVAYAKITNEPLNMETTEAALKDIMPPPKPRNITIESIQNEVCNYYDIKLLDMMSNKRSREIVLPRQIAMYLARHFTDASFPLLGDQFRRDHTTVIHACEKIEKKLLKDVKLKEHIEELMEKISPRGQEI